MFNLRVLYCFSSVRGFRVRPSVRRPPVVRPSVHRPPVRSLLALFLRLPRSLLALVLVMSLLQLLLLLLLLLPLAWLMLLQLMLPLLKLVYTTSVEVFSNDVVCFSQLGCSQQQLLLSYWCVCTLALENYHRA